MGNPPPCRLREASPGSTNVAACLSSVHFLLFLSPSDFCFVSVTFEVLLGVGRFPPLLFPGGGACPAVTRTLPSPGPPPPPPLPGRGSLSRRDSDASLPGASSSSRGVKITPRGVPFPYCAVTSCSDSNYIMTFFLLSFVRDGQIFFVSSTRDTPRSVDQMDLICPSGSSADGPLNARQEWRVVHFDFIAQSWRITTI